MTYRVQIKPSAEKEIGRLDRSVRERVMAAVRALADDPRPVGAKAMGGRYDGHYRIRVGKDIRVVYTVNDRELVVLVVKVGNRGDVY